MMNRKMTFWISILGVIGSLAIFTSIFDPFAFAKTFVIITGALGLLGFSISDLVRNRTILFGKQQVAFLLLIISFLVVFFIRAITSSDQNLAFFGVVGRSSGFITYFAYGLIFILSMTYLKADNFHLIVRGFLIIGFIGGFYSLLEKIGKNPWKMNSVYNGTSSLFGNPNFSGAILSLSIVASIWILMNRTLTREKMFAAINLPLALYGVYTSKALQGFISVIIGLTILVTIWLFKQNKKLGNLSLILSISVGLIGIFGSLNFGPLAPFLYKQSVAERGDMWRTALAMIRKNPLWGVGIERYGMDFRMYRDLNQSLRVGPDAFSDNAHNVILHLTATGGLFLGVCYLAIVIGIFIVGIKGLLASSGEKKSFLGAALALWLPIQAQNTISVDNPAVFVWSWILGGAIIAISLQADDPQNIKSERKSSKESISRSSTTHALAPLLIILSLSITVKPLIAQKSFQFAFYLGIDPNQPETLKNKEAALIKAEKEDPGNVTWPRYSANSLFNDQAWPETVAAAQRAIDKDPNDWVSWWFMASAYEKSGDFEKAIPARIKTIELDPLNTAVLLELAKDQKTVGDLAGLAATKAKVLAINPNAPEIPALNSL